MFISRLLAVNHIINYALNKQTIYHIQYKMIRKLKLCDREKKREIYIYIERDRGRVRERQRDRQREREIYIDRERHRYRSRERQIEKDRELLVIPGYPLLFIVLVILKNKYLTTKLIQGVHCDMLESKCIFQAEKLFSQA